MQDNNVFLIKRVINDLLDPQTSIEAALLKLNYFARLVKNDKLLRYTGLEVNGYKEESNVPKYRQTLATLNVVMAGGNYTETIELPVEMMEAPFNKKLQYIQMREGIRVIEAMAEKKIVENDHLIGTPVPFAMLTYIKKATDKLPNNRLLPKTAMVSGNPTLPMQIVSTVRYRLLAFATEIAEQFGYEIEIESFTGHLRDNNQIINNHIHSQIINNGNHNVNNSGNNAKVTRKEKQKIPTNRNMP